MLLSWARQRLVSMVAASVDELGSVVLADGGRGVLAERVEQADGVGLAGEFADGRFVGPLKADTSLLVLSCPPVILQRKTRAMIRGAYSYTHR